MAIYRFFLFQDSELVGRIMRECEDDVDALEVARALSLDHVVEVYCGERLAGRLKWRDDLLSCELIAQPPLFRYISP
jgi:hypothetical protein